jgi:hypothetical protein
MICRQKGFGYAQGDTTAKLTRHIMEKIGTDTFWEQPLISVGTLRNKLSTYHGAGEVHKVAPEHAVKYTLNLTASAINFFHDQVYQSSVEELNTVLNAPKPSFLASSSIRPASRTSFLVGK